MRNETVLIMFVAVSALASAAVQAQLGGMSVVNEADVPLADSSGLMLKRSDVVLSYPYAKPDVYGTYGVTVWGWGPDPAWTDHYAWRIRQAYDLGLRVVSSLVNPSILPPPRTAIARKLATDADLKRAVAIDIEGKPIITPFWPMDYGNGLRAWWYCTNNPAFVENALERLRMGIEAGANAFQVDMPYGSAYMLDHGVAGCFCDFCLAGFREYLEANYPAARLEQMGVSNIESFDYRLMAAQVAGTTAEFNKAYRRRGTIPLIDEFTKYQFSSATRFIERLVELAKEVGGADMPVSANCGGLMPKYLMAADLLDYFVVEVPHYQMPGHVAILPYKLADALGKPLALWPVGQDVERIEQGNLTGLLKRWIALSYAFGGNMMVPHRLWSNTTTTGINWYQTRAEDYAPLYRFVRRNADLFDDYEAVEQVGVIYSNRALREGNHEVFMACWQLLEANIPFGLALAGDEYLPRTLDKSEVASRFELVVVPEPAMLEGMQLAAVNGLKAEGRAMTWTDVKAILERVEPLAALESRSAVWLFPRTKPHQPNAPVVVHLINYSYDEATNTTHTQSDVAVLLRPELLGGKKARGVTLLTPSDEPTALSFATKADGIHVTVPELELWGILRIVLE